MGNCNQILQLLVGQLPVVMNYSGVILQPIKSQLFNGWISEQIKMKKGKTDRSYKQARDVKW